MKNLILKNISNVSFHQFFHKVVPKSPEGSFGGGDEQELPIFCQPRHILIVLEQAPDTLHGLLFIGVVQKHFAQPVNDKVLPIHSIPDRRRVQIRIILNFYFIFCLCHKLSFVQRRQLQLFELVVSACCEQVGFEGGDESDGASMPKNLLQHLIFLPVPKSQVAIIPAQNQHIVIVEFLFHGENGIPSSIVLLLVLIILQIMLNLPDFHCAVP